MTTVTWTGKSGTDYAFELYPSATDFFAVPGVYIVCRALQVGGVTRYEALYVGEAQSLEDRLNTNGSGHDGLKRALKMGATHIAARVVNGGAAERLRIETDLRHSLNPSCNAEPVPENAVLAALLRR